MVIAVRQPRRLARREAELAAEQRPCDLCGHAAPAAPAEPDYAAELEQLAQLKNQGILTEEEFQAKKKQILGI